MGTHEPFRNFVKEQVPGVEFVDIGGDFPTNFEYLFSGAEVEQFTLPFFF
tara:strand:+ start:481 stop:630 length:150 start_codon:yes stop_codon:yes gene_type:complete